MNLNRIMPAEEGAKVTLEPGDRVLVLSGGDHEPVPDTPPDASLVIAADSGLHLAERLGIGVDLVVGDLDSVDTAALDRAVATGARVERHPVDKDRTDLELALDTAVRSGRHVTVLAGGGGRLDHLIAGALALASPEFARVVVDGVIGAARVWVVHGGIGGSGEVTLGGTPGEYVSLIPVHGTARGVRTSGLTWALQGDTLRPGSSRTVSNRFASSRATVALEQGTLLVIAPGTDIDEPGRHDSAGPVGPAHRDEGPQ